MEEVDGRRDTEVEPSVKVVGLYKAGKMEALLQNVLAFLLKC